MNLHRNAMLEKGRRAMAVGSATTISLARPRSNDGYFRKNNITPLQFPFSALEDFFRRCVKRKLLLLSLTRLLLGHMFIFTGNDCGFNDQQRAAIDRTTRWSGKVIPHIYPPLEDFNLECDEENVTGEE